MIDPTKDYGLEAVDANGQATHFPTMRAAIAAGIDRRHIEACLEGERDSHALRRWRVADALSAIPAFCAYNFTTEPPTTATPAELEKLEISGWDWNCIDGHYRGYLWFAGLRGPNGLCDPVRQRREGFLRRRFFGDWPATSYVVWWH